MSIQKDGNKFKVYYSFIGDDGKLHKTTKRGFNTKKEAKTFELSKIAEIKENKTTKTFRNAFNEWLSRKNVVDSYIRCLNYYFEQFVTFKDLPIRNLNKEIVNTWAVELAKNKHYKPKTINDIYKEVRSILKYCTEIYDIPDYSIVIKNLKVIPVEKEVLTKDEFDMMVEVETNPIAKAMMWTAYYTGLRVGEIRGLEKTDLKDHSLTVRQHLDKYYKVIKGTKTSPYSEEVFLDDITYQILKPLAKRPGKWLFGDSEPVCYRYLIDHLAMDCKKAGITKHVTPHTLRHSHGSLLLSQGVDILTVQKRLHHKSLSTTTRTYLHEIKDSEQEVVNTLNKLNRGSIDLKTLSRKELETFIQELLLKSNKS